MCRRPPKTGRRAPLTARTKSAGGTPSHRKGGKQQHKVKTIRFGHIATGGTCPAPPVKKPKP